MAGAGVDSPRLEAQLLAAHVLLVDRSWVIAHPEHELPDLAAETLLQRRERREPLAYIVGWREFYGRRFAVRPGVLIPRQETETLVEVALREGTKGEIANRESRIASDPAPRPQTPKPFRLLDLGTGSGILAITLKLERPDWQVTGSDVSPDAMAVARENAETLGADVRFVLSDAFNALQNERFDLIVSNPPYIANAEPLMPEVVLHEPAKALYSGETGLEFYELLAREAGAHLSPGGSLVVELGDDLADRVSAVFEAAGWIIRSRVKDLLGIERCLVVGA